MCMQRPEGKDSQSCKYLKEKHWRQRIHPKLRPGTRACVVGGDARRPMRLGQG